MLGDRPRGKSQSFFLTSLVLNFRLGEEAVLFTVVGIREREGCVRWKHPLTPVILCFLSPSFHLGSLGCPHTMLTPSRGLLVKRSFIDPCAD